MKDNIIRAAVTALMLIGISDVMAWPPGGSQKWTKDAAPVVEAPAVEVAGYKWGRKWDNNTPILAGYKWGCKPRCDLYLNYTVGEIIG